MEQVTRTQLTQIGDSEQTSSGLSVSIQDALLGLYDAANRPEQYWATLKLLDGLHDDKIEKTDIAQHAEGLRSLIEQSLELTSSSQSLVKNSWSVDFDRAGNITCVSKRNQSLWSGDVPQCIWDFPFYEDDLFRLRELLKNRLDGGLVFVLLDERRQVSRIAQVVEIASRGSYRMYVRQIRLPNGARQTLLQNFGVTDAQFGVLERLVEGQSIQKIFG